jgi:hypothetical protein
LYLSLVLFVCVLAAVRLLSQHRGALQSRRDALSVDCRAVDAVGTSVCAASLTLSAAASAKHIANCSGIAVTRFADSLVSAMAVSRFVGLCAARQMSSYKRLRRTWRRSSHCLNRASTVSWLRQQPAVRSLSGVIFFPFLCLACDFGYVGRKL